MALYDENDHEYFNHDLQNKDKWCRIGEKKEIAFVRIYGELLGYAINPDKADNSTVPDLISLRNKGVEADLKTQNTPFFKAKEKGNIDPQYAVTFNRKDRLNYRTYHPKIEILFWVNWEPVKAVFGNTSYEVGKLNGIFKTTFSQLDRLLENAYLHDYKQRETDTQGNAKNSYIIDIRNAIFTQLA